MGNFFSDAGGALLGTGGTKTETKQRPTMTKEQQALLKQLIGTASEQGPTPSYPGQSYVPMTTQEESFLKYAGGETQTPANQALLNVLSGQPAYQVDPAATEQYYQKSILDPTMDVYRNTTLPLLTESFAGPGFWSSNRANATQQSISDLTQNLASQRAELYYKDEQARRTALENAANRRAQVAPAAVEMESQNLGTAGQWSRSIAQEKVASDLARWLSGEEMDGQYISAYNPNTKLALALLGVQPYTYTQEQTTVGKGILTGLLSGIGSGVGQGLGQSMTS